MPQTGPMWWMALFAMIESTFIIFFIIIYFALNYQKIKALIKSFKFKKPSFWKW